MTKIRITQIGIGKTRRGAGIACGRSGNKYVPNIGAEICMMRAGRLHRDEAWIPISMIRDRDFVKIKRPVDWERLRCRHDFHYWLVNYVCVSSRHGGWRPYILSGRERAALRQIADLSRGEVVAMLIGAACRRLAMLYIRWQAVAVRSTWHKVVQSDRISAGLRRRFHFSNIFNKVSAEFTAEIHIGKHRHGVGSPDSAFQMDSS